MKNRELPASWRPYNTYDYVPVEDWSVGNDIELYAVYWDGKPHSPNGFNNDWTLYINARAKAKNGAENSGHDVCLVLQVTSCQKDAFRVRFNPGAASFADYPNKVYGPVEVERLTHIRQHEQAAGYQPILRWNRHGASIQLHTIQVQFVRADDGLLSIQVKRLADGAVTDISSGPLCHASPEVGTVVNMKRKAEHATHYFGLGEILSYNLTGRHNPATGSTQQDCYGYKGCARLDHSGSQVTCYNYDNLWYNQPEVFPQSVPYKDAFKATSCVPMYLNAPFYIEKSTLNGSKQFLGVFLDNTGQSYFSLKSALRDAAAVEAGVQHGEFDGHYMFAAQAANVLDAFTYLMGQGDLAAGKHQLNDRSVMPPKYIFGYFQAKYGSLGLLRPQNEKDPNKVYIEDLVKGHRDAEIPIEGLGVDIDVQEDKKVFTIKDSFWSSGKVDQGISVFDWITQFDLQCQTNITPFIRADKVAYDPTNSGKKQYGTAEGLIRNGYCVQNEGEANLRKFRGPRRESDYPGLSYSRIGETNYPDQNLLVLDYGINVQTGERDMIGSVVTDYGNPAAARFWGDQYAYLFKNGLGFVWQDMTVPDAMPHVEDGKNFADTESPRNQFGWSLTGEAPSDDRRRTNTFNWRSYHGQLHLTDPRFGDGRKTPFVELRNFHAYMLARASYEHGLIAHEETLKGYKRSYIICRSGYPGLQHYAGHWIGDNASTWHHLQATVPLVLNLGMSGLPIAGADVGGFAPGEAPADPASTFYGDKNYRNHNPMVYDRLVLGPEDVDIGAICEPELMTRWVQAACLQPWMRNHYDAMKAYQEIYHYTSAATANGETFCSIMTAFIRFRVRWHHLLYDAMYQNTQTGAPLIKAMCLWQGDDAIFSDAQRDILATQFFIDSTVLVAPIMTSSPAGEEKHYTAEKAVYFPHGELGQTINWYRYNVMEDSVDIAHPIASGQRLKITADITSLPVFIREGAIIPERHAQANLQAAFKNIQVLDKYKQPLVLSVYPLGNATESRYQLYWDDGGVTRNAERDGAFSVIDVRQAAAGEGSSTLTIAPQKYDYPLYDFIYFRIRANDSAVRNISVGKSRIALHMASVEALFQHQGEAMHIDASGSIWLKARTAKLALDTPLVVNINA